MRRSVTLRAIQSIFLLIYNCSVFGGMGSPQLYSVDVVVIDFGSTLSPITVSLSFFCFV